MKQIIRKMVAVCGCLVVLLASRPAGATEIRVLCSNGLRAVVEELAPQFERATHHKVVLQFEPSSQLKKRIDAGEPFDLAVLTTGLIDEVINEGKIASDSRMAIARSGLGLSIRAGASKPEIGTIEGFKRTLLGAESITYATQGASAAPFEALVEKLGIAAQLATKYKLRSTAAQVGEAVANGSVEIGVAPVSEILPVKGVDLVGAFPAQIQSYVEMAAGVGTNAREKDAARDLIRFLTVPANLPVLKAKGMEPSTTK
jgi:molybdate transport system substrate-binding protein